MYYGDDLTDLTIIFIMVSCIPFRRNYCKDKAVDHSIELVLPEFSWLIISILTEVNAGDYARK